MKKLREYAERHGVSKPIFNIVVKPFKSSSDELPSIREIDLVLKQEHRYVPETNEADPLTILIAKSRNEVFSMRSREFLAPHDTTVRNALDLISSQFLDFLRRNLPNKQPTHTSIYKWYRRSLFNILTLRDSKVESTDDAILALYKYVYKSVDNSGKILDSKKEHSQNIIALLEALMEKLNNESKGK